ncbi:MAG: MFS transporter [Acidobacteria bacterium]|nr:MFS transporter [Acidobacteriota bacterium]
MTERRRSGAPDHTPAIAEFEKLREHIRGSARAALGITGVQGVPPLRETVRHAGVGWYPLAALGLLVIVDEFQGYGFFVLGPEISRTLGISAGMLAALVALKTVAMTLAALPMAALVQRRAGRNTVAVTTAFAWSVATMFTGFVAGAWGLLLVMLADGASSGSVNAVHAPLVVDSYPPAARVRVLVAYRSFAQTGNITAPLLVALLVGAFSFTWRGVFIVMGCLSVLVAVVAVRLQDPGYGRFDANAVRDVVAGAVGDRPGTVDEDVHLGFFEIVSRLLLIPTIRRILAAFAVLGMAMVPLFTFLFFFLEDRWDMGPSARGLFFAVMPLFSIGALAWFAPRGEAMFRQDPGRLVRLTALFIGGGTALLALAIFVPAFWLMAALFGSALAMLGLVLPCLNVAMLSIVPPRMRPHASALAGMSMSAVGGFGGLLLLGGIDRRFGTGGAIASLAGPGIIAALVLFGAARTIGSDLDRMVDEMVERVELDHLRARGRMPSMLACRRVDFSYGQLQVLFGVDFTVDDGEMVALLGTNGAGKSTLLRVISGLGLPSAGTVRFGGADVTYVAAERRLALGVAQVPGGRAVFPTLSVVENLRLYQFSLGRDRRARERGIETAFEAFPQLAERRSLPAATLSGGEQQMLGLAKALVLRPRLLLIDELSLGLAPIIVAELLEAVRRINAAGTAVVLVEQSVNVALSLVDHAYFMEKGQIRFDGSSRDLLAREDLLRSVFLEGAERTGRMR